MLVMINNFRYFGESIISQQLDLLLLVFGGLNVVSERLQSPDVFNVNVIQFVDILSQSSFWATKKSNCTASDPVMFHSTVLKSNNNKVWNMLKMIPIEREITSGWAFNEKKSQTTRKTHFYSLNEPVDREIVEEEYLDEEFE